MEKSALGDFLIYLRKDIFLILILIPNIKKYKGQRSNFGLPRQNICVHIMRGGPSSSVLVIQCSVLGICLFLERYVDRETRVTTRNQLIERKQ